MTTEPRLTAWLADRGASASVTAMANIKLAEQEAYRCIAESTAAARSHCSAALRQGRQARRDIAAARGDLARAERDIAQAIERKYAAGERLSLARQRAEEAKVELKEGRARLHRTMQLQATFATAAARANPQVDQRGLVLRQFYANGSRRYGRPEEVRKAARRKYQREWITRKRAAQKVERRAENAMADETHRPFAP